MSRGKIDKQSKGLVDEEVFNGEEMVDLDKKAESDSQPPTVSPSRSLDYSDDDPFAGSSEHLSDSSSEHLSDSSSEDLSDSSSEDLSDSSPEDLSDSSPEDLSDSSPEDLSDSSPEHPVDKTSGLNDHWSTSSFHTKTTKARPAVVLEESAGNTLTDSADHEVLQDLDNDEELPEDVKIVATEDALESDLVTETGLPTIAVSPSLKESSIASTKSYRNFNLTVRGRGTHPSSDISAMVQGSDFYDEDELFVLYAYRQKPTVEEKRDNFQFLSLPRLELTTDEQKKLRSEEGLTLYSPLGQEITFKRTPTTLMAVLKKEEPAPGEDETHTKLRNAQSLITMIYNVRHKCKTVRVETADPFLAQIASSYFKYLETQGISMEGSTLPSLSSSIEEKQKVDQLFTKHFLTAFESPEVTLHQLLLAGVNEEQEHTPGL